MGYVVSAFKEYVHGLVRLGPQPIKVLRLRIVEIGIVKNGDFQPARVSGRFGCQRKNRAG